MIDHEDLLIETEPDSEGMNKEKSAKQKMEGFNIKSVSTEVVRVAVRLLELVFSVSKFGKMLNPLRRKKA